MNKQNNRTDFGIGRILAFSFFLVILFTIKSSNCPETHSVVNSASIEYVVDIDNSAIIFETSSTPKYNILLSTLELISVNSDNNYSIEHSYSSIRANVLYRICSNRFSILKPLLAMPNSLAIRFSANKKDSPSIS